MFCGDAGAGHVGGMIATCRLVFGREAVGKLRTVVGQNLAELDRRELETAQLADDPLASLIT